MQSVFVIIAKLIASNNYFLKSFFVIILAALGTPLVLGGASKCPWRFFPPWWCIKSCLRKKSNREAMPNHADTLGDRFFFPVRVLGGIVLAL